MIGKRPRPLTLVLLLTPLGCGGQSQVAETPAPAPSGAEETTLETDGDAETEHAAEVVDPQPELALRVDHFIPSRHRVGDPIERSPDVLERMIERVGQGDPARAEMLDRLASQYQYNADRSQERRGPLLLRAIRTWVRLLREHPDYRDVDRIMASAMLGLRESGKHEEAGAVASQLVDDFSSSRFLFLARLVLAADLELRDRAAAATAYEALDVEGVPSDVRVRAAIGRTRVAIALSDAAATCLWARRAHAVASGEAAPPPAEELSGWAERVVAERCGDQ